MGIKSYQDLIAWQKSVTLVEEVYRVTHDWPKEELYGLTNQARRAAVPVPANIAEGHGRLGRKEFLHHLSIASGSVQEAETHLSIAKRLGHANEPTCEALMRQTAEVGRLLTGPIRSLQAPANNPYPLTPSP